MAEQSAAVAGHHGPARGVTKRNRRHQLAGLGAAIGRITIEPAAVGCAMAGGMPAMQDARAARVAPTSIVTGMGVAGMGIGGTPAGQAGRLACRRAAGPRV